MEKNIKATIKFKCAKCGLVTRGRKPKGGDGSFYYPSRHNIGGNLCEGVYMEAVWVTNDSNKSLTPLSPTK